MARAKGRAAAAPRTSPLADVDNPAPALSNAAITVEDPPSTSAPSEDGQPAKKKQKKAVSGNKAEKTTAVAEPDKPRQSKKKEGIQYERGTALVKKYWEEVIPSLAPKDTDIETLKNALSTMRKITVSQLKKKGEFTIHGICSIRVVHRKGRDAGKMQLFGQPIDVKARPPHKKLVLKTARCLQDSVCKEINK